MRHFAKTSLAALLWTVVVACGVTEASNPDDDKKPKPSSGKAAFVLRLSDLKIAVGGRVDLAMKGLSSADGAPITRSVDQAPDEIVIDEVDPGLYELALTSKTASGRTRHKQIVEVVGDLAAEDQARGRAIERACADVTAATALPKFTDLVTDPAQATKAPADAKLHVVTAYESLGQACATADKRGFQEKARADGNYGVVRVKVSEPNVALYLSTYEPVTWWVDVAPGASVASITMSGYHQSSIVGVPPSVTKVLTSSFEGGQDDATTFIQNFEQRYERTPSEVEQRAVCSSKPSLMKEGDYEADKAVIRKLTGLAEITSVQAVYSGSLFHVTPFTRGELTTTEREAGQCYKDDDGVIREYLP